MKELTCIVCPNGCRITVEETDGKLYVKGNRCAKGEQFAVSEMMCPMRTISSTVRTAWKDIPVLPVRVSSEIPKDKMFDVMEKLRKVIVEEPIKRGDIIIKDVCGLGVDVIATSNILNWKKSKMEGN